MDGKAKERWCMLRWAGGAQDRTVNIDRIMLRYRPIAPKPAMGGTASGILQADNRNVLVNNKRSKRKYVRVRKNNNGYRRKNKTTEEHGSKDGSDGKIVTLQLLPEREDSEDPTKRRLWCNYVDKTGEEKVVSGDKYQPPGLNLKNNQVFDGMVGLGVSDQTAVMPQRRVVETLVTVESVTDTCNMDSRGIGSADNTEIIMMNLERDTCPAFISDGLNRVRWVNGAYKRMVMVSLEKEGQSVESAETVTVLVLLVIKDNKLKLPSQQLSSFTCKVRVQYTWQKQKYSKMVPCDVWRLMEFGGFAWRLDIEAALSLGR
ncbi:hypothetical protein ACOSP7_001944 [Xanthoceras sorbifolium]|uniref:DUF7950 domain-containing protein n=1 Tax=Xanthoceras sorbifolium TaxID=99658 RepID=A0ABQ8IKQ7_9ROSI|nr:hypothetical protein JRO89_XS01G0225100 [Xanthoceras sorbifolium]